MKVTAGTARGRTLLAPATDLRPTQDKIKQAIFSMLEAEALKRGHESNVDEDGRLISYATGVAWPVVLDLFAGSGALGIEALSRGAKRATFVERDRAASQMIGQNLEKTGFEEQAEIIRSPVARALASHANTYDLILLDPPYKDVTEAISVLETIAERKLLHPQGLIVVEHNRAMSGGAEVPHFRLVRRRDHGTTAVTVLRAHSAG